MPTVWYSTIVLTYLFYFIKSNAIHEDEEIANCNVTCTTEECVKYANQILNFVRKDVDPCQDFYSFACGGFTEKFGYNDTKSVYDEAWNSMQISVKDLLENLQLNKGSASEKMKIMYNTCMTSKKSELTVMADAREFLNSLWIENWPKLNIDFEFGLERLTEALGKLAAYGEFSFLTFKTTPFKNELPHSENLQVALILPDQVLANSKLNPKDIKSTVFKILDYFHIEKEELNKIWKEFLEIENATLGLLNEDSNNRQKCNEDRRSSYLSLNCSGNTTENFKSLCRFWKSVIKHGDLENHFNKEIIHISCRWNLYSYVENIFTKLADMNQRSIAHYLAMRFFMAHLDDFNLYFQLVKKAHSSLQGSKHNTTAEATSRWEFCVAWIFKSMNLALGYEYTRNIFKEPVEEDILSIIREYIKEMSNEITSQNWVNEQVKPFLKNQIEKLEIGFEKSLKNYRNETFVNRFYNEFHPVNESFLRTVLEYQKSSVVLKNKRKTHFNNFFSTSDPLSMDFGFALFIPPTYTHGMAKFVKYATIGFLIGHELSHNLKFALDVVELDEDTDKYIRSKLQCYIEEYSKFVIDKTGKNITSRETIEEITADNIGWSLTEKILAKLFENSNIFVPLLGTSYTPKQLAYIAFAQASCEVLSKTVETALYRTSPQSLEKLRVLGILQNSRAFSEVFQCPENALMNAAKKCVFFE